MIRDVDNYFNHWHDTEWFNDSIVQQIVLDIDKTKIEGPNLAISPVLGAIPPTKISGGSKCLILALKTDNLIYGSGMGDNCVSWLLKIAEKKDVRMYLGHIMDFPEKFEAVCLDDERQIHSRNDFVKAFAYHVDGIDLDDDEDEQ